MGALKQRAILYGHEIARVPEEEKMMERDKKNDKHYSEALNRIIQEYTATPDDPKLWDEEVWVYKRGRKECACKGECKTCKCKGE